MNDVNANTQRMKVGIVGAGQMGTGIAQACASAGIEVLLNDVEEEAIGRALRGIVAATQRQVAKSKISEEAGIALIGNISACVALEEFVECGFIIEAATENTDIKLQILKRVEGIAMRDCVIASNTSSVSITRLASHLQHHDRFIGMHFFNPVPVMNLVEVISGIATSESTVAKAMDLAVRLGKTPIRVRNSPGFVVNRVLIPMINEAVLLLQEGVASAAEIDEGMRLGANHPLGPLALADLIGLDTCLAIMEVLYRDFGDTKYRPATLLREMVDARRLGRKTCQGFYSY
jgi:3-hydroxybutyryl-CoA dehydrogenase